MILRQAILGALCGAMTAVGAATAVIAFSSSPAEAYECGHENKTKFQFLKLYCKTRNSPPAKRKVDGTVDKFNHPRITKRR